MFDEYTSNTNWQDNKCVALPYASEDHIKHIHYLRVIANVLQLQFSVTYLSCIAVQVSCTSMMAWAELWPQKL